MEQLTSRQISEWEAYDTLDPIGSWRDEFRTARIESLLLNIVNHLFAKDGTTPQLLEAIDFIPDWTGEREPKTKKQSVEEMKQALMSWATSHNKSLERNKGSVIRSTPPVKKRRT